MSLRGQNEADVSKVTKTGERNKQSERVLLRADEVNTD